MKKSVIFFTLLWIGTWLPAQDTFQEFLFPADFILTHKEAIRLNARQENRIKSIHNENLVTFSQKRKAVNQATEQLNLLLQAESLDQSQIGAQIDKVLSLENELKKLQLQNLLSIRNELSNNQVAQLKTLRKEEKASSLNVQTDQVISIRSENPNSERSPAYFIDRKGTYELLTDISTIEPKDIASITVLKGDQAIERFGSAGNNGVIIITLKEE